MKIVKNIVSIAKNVLQNESRALARLADFIDQQFEDAVKEILKSKGRVIVTGIGKSAIIANKMVATFNSTGTPAVFMHAADAIHGDLGIVQKEDVVICLSKSGNTPEIKVLVPLLKRTGSKLIALVGNIDSYLANHADYVLNVTIEQEACPHNLAPTTSTTAAMAMGDAIAVALIESRDFSSSDFARYHPGGALGKRLYLKICDIYPNHDLPLVKEDSTIQDVIFEISSKRLGATAVCDKNGALKGIVTDGDLRRMLKNFSNIANLKARDIMSASPRTINDQEYAVNALNLMQNNNITQLVVLKEGKVAGFVHIHDLLKEGLL